MHTVIVFWFLLGLFSHDISTTMELLSMVHQSADEEILITIDWDTVDAHAQRVANSKTRIDIDPDCLRWTPLVSHITSSFKANEVIT